MYRTERFSAYVTLNRHVIFKFDNSHSRERS